MIVFWALIVIAVLLIGIIIAYYAGDKVTNRTEYIIKKFKENDINEEKENEVE